MPPELLPGRYVHRFDTLLGQGIASGSAIPVIIAAASIAVGAAGAMLLLRRVRAELGAASGRADAPRPEHAVDDAVGPGDLQPDEGEAGRRGAARGDGAQRETDRVDRPGARVVEDGDGGAGRDVPDSDGSKAPA